MAILTDPAYRGPVFRITDHHVFQNCSTPPPPCRLALSILAIPPWIPGSGSLQQASTARRRRHHSHTLQQGRLSLTAICFLSRRVRWVPSSLGPYHLQTLRLELPAQTRPRSLPQSLLIVIGARQSRSETLAPSAALSMTKAPTISWQRMKPIRDSALLHRRLQTRASTQRMVFANRKMKQSILRDESHALAHLWG